MNLFEKYKIQLMIKRFTFLELETVKKFVDAEYKKRKKDLLQHK